MKPVKLSELISAIEGQSEENVTRVDLKTGEVVLVEDLVLRAVEEDNEEALKDWADWQKPELEIARAMVADELGRAIKGKGAFRYFKDTVHRLGLREKWFRFRDDALKELVIDWAEAKKVPYEDDLETPK